MSEIENSNNDRLFTIEEVINARRISCGNEQHIVTTITEFYEQFCYSNYIRRIELFKLTFKEKFIEQLNNLLKEKEFNKEFLNYIKNNN